MARPLSALRLIKAQQLLHFSPSEFTPYRHINIAYQ